MDINIITFDSVPHSAYLNPLIALKRYRTLSEDEDIIGDYGIITLPIQDTSQSTHARDATKPCEYCSIEDLAIYNYCPRCGRCLRP